MSRVGSLRSRLPRFHPEAQLIAVKVMDIEVAHAVVFAASGHVL